jgi:hypothetical protein
MACKGKVTQLRVPFAVDEDIRCFDVPDQRHRTAVEGRGMSYDVSE